MTEASGARRRAAWLTAAAMVAFASNSVLCRLALRGGEIDAAGFTTIRLLSGAVVLWLLALRRPRGAPVAGTSWASALSLFAYAGAFSFAYLELDAGTGALILFGMVQLTMVTAGRLHGQRLERRQWQGLALSAAGLLALTLPGVGPANPVGALLMAIAGVGWGIYSFRGRLATDALASTSGNFLRSVPFAILLALLSRESLHASSVGLGLALVSGGMASALGYILWYAALRDLLAIEAALVQLSVPVITAFGGALVIGEPLTLRALLSGVAILSGIALAVTGRVRPKVATPVPTGAVAPGVDGS